MINNEDFSKRLHKIMEYYQLSATAFADAIHVGRSSISHILSGRNKPSLEFVMKTIEAFPEVELYWLLNGKGTFPKAITAPKINSDPSSPASKKNVSATKMETTDLFSTAIKNTTIPNPPSENPVHEKINELTSNNRTIDRIVIFYTDGSFEGYRPQ